MAATTSSSPVGGESTPPVTASSSNLDATLAAPATPASRADTMRATLPVRNVVSVFAAHFHVRRGNEIVWAEGNHSVDQLSKADVEWKVLPSGSHLVERDVIYFSMPRAPVGSNDQDASARGRLFGVAAFKNKKLDANVRSGVMGDEADDDQRGARMTAVGAIVDCGPTLTPWTQIAATVPHIEQLRKLTDAFVSDPSCFGLLKEWYEMHRRSDTVKTSLDRSSAFDAAPSPMYAHDPLYMLPAVSNALGPLLPSLLKQLLVSSQRMLIYVPHGVSTVQAASIAFNLGELTQAGCQAQDAADSLDNAVASGSRGCPVKSHGLVIRGTVGLHDVTTLQEESKQPQLPDSWIAWTSDRILVEKPGLYDILLDLTPMAEAQLSSQVGQDGYEAPLALPKLVRVSREVVNGKTRTITKKQTWTTREFAVFRGLDEQASLQATSPRHIRRAHSRRAHQQSLRRSSSEPANLPSTSAGTLAAQSASRTARNLTLFAFLRFWLASLWIIPPRWRANLRSSYGYVPLSIRSDGGVRASIMLLPEDDSDTSDDEDSESESGAPSSRAASRTHLGVPHSPQPRTRSLSVDEVLDGDAGMPDDFADDPILAAAGAGSVASSNRRRRKSRTLASHKSTTQHLSDVAALQSAAGADLVTPVADSMPKQQLEELREARESVSLALCLFSSWSEWVADLVTEVLDLVQDRADAAALRLEEASAQDNAPAATATPSSRTADASASPTDILELSPRDMRDLGLSSTNAVDVDLVQYLASSVTDAQVTVRKSWPLLRLFGW